MISKVIVFNLIFLVAQNHAFKFGKCPPTTVLTDYKFNVTSYLGRWYEIARLDNFFESGLKCVTADYEPMADGRIKVINRGLDKSNEEHTSKGVAKVTSPGPENLLKVKFSTFSPEAPYWVVKSDTKKYALVLSCLDFLKAFRCQNAWILSRAKTLDPIILTDLYKELNQLNYSTTNMLLVDQVNCPRTVQSPQKS